MATELYLEAEAGLAFQRLTPLGQHAVARACARAAGGGVPDAFAPVAPGGGLEAARVDTAAWVAGHAYTPAAGLNFGAARVGQGPLIAALSASEAFSSCAVWVAVPAPASERTPPPFADLALVLRGQERNTAGRYRGVIAEVLAVREYRRRAGALALHCPAAAAKQLELIYADHAAHRDIMAHAEALANGLDAVAGATAAPMVLRPPCALAIEPLLFDAGAGALAPAELFPDAVLTRAPGAAALEVLVEMKTTAVARAAYIDGATHLEHRTQALLQALARFTATPAGGAVTAAALVVTFEDGGVHCEHAVLTAGTARGLMAELVGALRPTVIAPPRLAPAGALAKRLRATAPLAGGDSLVALALHGAAEPLKEPREAPTTPHAGADTLTVGSRVEAQYPDGWHEGIAISAGPKVEVLWPRAARGRAPERTTFAGAELAQLHVLQPQGE